MEMPVSIRDVAHLEELLSEPSDAAIEAMRRANGDVIVLGVAGKMGPTLARMARRAMDAAGHRHRVIGVSRFSSPDEQRALEAGGVETIRCDLLDDSAIARLPDAPHVVFMAGRKFGSAGNEPLTWAMNAHLPALVCAPISPQPHRRVLDGERLRTHPTRPRRLAEDGCCRLPSASTR